ncbi:MAG: hypothetical protein M9938_11200, partial [Solirubrobacterales bacterium]|nr:hypothetical protein [Solirubrobacterales bacterium]
REPALSDRLWDGVIEFVHTPAPNAEGPRLMAILLDRIGALAAAPAAHILDDSYDALLSDAQKELRTQLRSTWSLIESKQLDQATREAITDALGRIGRPPG